MKLKVTEQEDDFALNGEFAYRDGRLYEIWESSRTYVAGNCMGAMRAVIMELGEIEWIYPLMGGGGFEILTPNIITKYRNIIGLVDGKGAAQ